MVLSSCKAGDFVTESLSKSSVVEQKNFRSTKVHMIIDHQEVAQHPLLRCYYASVAGKHGESIGVMVYAEKCPKSIVYDFSENTWIADSI